MPQQSQRTSIQSDEYIYENLQRRREITPPLVGTLNNVTINLTPSGWHISFNLAIEHDAPGTLLPARVGIDRRVAESLALFTGEMLTLPSSLAVLDCKKKKAQRVLARRKCGSV